MKKRTTRSSYYRRPTVRRTTRRTYRRKTYRKRRTVRVYRRRGYRNRYSRAYLYSSAYLATRRSFNYGLCRGYGYYNYFCIGRSGYTFSYWEPSMNSLCASWSKSRYYNSRCIGRSDYSIRRPTGRTTVVIRSRGGAGGAIVGALAGLCFLGMCVCCFCFFFKQMCCGGSKVEVVEESYSESYSESEEEIIEEVVEVH